MNQDTPIQTQPEPESIARAGDILEAILLCDRGEVDVEARLAIGSALATLYDVHPPYPPRGAPAQPIRLRDGVQAALQSLTAAVTGADSVEQAVRAGLAARQLHPLRDRS